MEGIGRFLEDAPVEGQPAELAIEEAAFRLKHVGCGDRRHGDARRLVHQFVTTGKDAGFLIQCV